jgi:hypothetical protein
MLLSLWECGNIIGQFRHDRLWNRPFLDRFSRLAVPRREGVAVKMKVTDTQDFGVAPAKSGGHGQQNPQARSRVLESDCKQVPHLRHGKSNHGFLRHLEEVPE